MTVIQIQYSISHFEPCIRFQKGKRSSNSPTIMATLCPGVPSEEPSLSNPPSAGPSLSTLPSQEPTSFPNEPSLSFLPSQAPSECNTICFGAPSEEPSLSISPSGKPSTITEPSNIPSTSPSLSKSPSQEPTSSPSTSQKPSTKPTLSLVPSQAPSECTAYPVTVVETTKERIGCEKKSKFNMQQALHCADR